MREAVVGSAGGGRKRKGKGRDEFQMVPDATFTSYYGRPIVKPAPWTDDIPAYLFLGGMAAGSSMLAAGATVTGRPALRRTGRLGALVGITASMYALVHDLGKPARFHHMLRVAKPTSPMSVGTWILTAYGPMAGLAGAAELRPFLPRRLREGLGAPVSEAGPARRLAVGGAVLELAMEHKMESAMGITAEPLHEGRAGALMKASKALTAFGAVGAALLGARSRTAAAVSGAALLAGSACTRFGVFEAGQESARDPKYTVVPQRERLNAGRPVRSDTPTS
ncbi:MAG: polysulfide reductase NrfD [Actinobacteria bacterium]|nr:polysulfide reductase NrfD [Actinomycetota bacterium]